MLRPVSLTGLGIPETAPDDVRIGRLISLKEEEAHLTPPSLQKDAFRVCILGFESDEGVRRNGGRVGASRAPDTIRSAFYRMTPDPQDNDAFKTLMAKTIDFGNLPANALELSDAQQKLGIVAATLLRNNVIPVVIGGGHETSFGHFLGYAEAGIPVSIINWDAHADVRPLKNGLPHSGSPFYQALEHKSGMLRAYTVAGLKRQSTAKSHLDYLHQKMTEGRAKWFFKGELNKRMMGNLYDRQKGAIMVTMDMDALSQHIAPGVSAPNPDGIPLDLWLHAAYCAGKHPRVRSFDLTELNPAFDTDGHTARVAALTLWTFFKGLSERSTA
ncbi:formiminoglutamase [Cyclonatronum proteinivorum]|uniref:Formiminoglutamase n=1 Tax=Cyclonatronum proteinivorum TaxID=1457365 RepID=A0A345UHG4_9BACT|nr:formimidoylglutamase [Cyclonatronum proteinivorum]AXI99915.1 formiminoglutamase [Cyclonatronum proteinivorum]